MICWINYIVTTWMNILSKKWLGSVSPTANMWGVCIRRTSECIGVQEEVTMLGHWLYFLENSVSMAPRKQKQACYVEASGLAWKPGSGFAGRMVGKLWFRTQLNRQEGQSDIFRRWKDIVRPSENIRANS